MFLPGWRSCDGGSQTRLMTTDVSTCEKQHRQKEPAGQVGIPTRVEVHVTGHPGHV